MVATSRYGAVVATFRYVAVVATSGYVAVVTTSGCGLLDFHCGSTTAESRRYIP